jgi:CRP-like cAMP-binding protein
VLASYAKVQMRAVGPPRRKETMDKPESPQPGDFLNPLKRKFAVFYTGEEVLEDIFLPLCSAPETLRRGHTLVREGEPYGDIFLLVSGWVERFKLLPDGRKQIVNFALPGDLLCFDAGTFARAHYSLETATETVVCRIPVDGMGRIFQASFRLGRAISWVTAHEEALLIERIVSLGQRSALERTAHLFCEFWRRLQILGLAEGQSYEMPLTQQHLGDILGLSHIYLNRVLRRLRELNLIVLTRGSVRILDAKSLERLAGFEEEYLHFTEHMRPR